MNRNTLVSLIVLVLFMGGVIWLIRRPIKIVPSKYDAFATCIKDSGTKFYGAFWCPHCAKQKALFGTAVRMLPYVECSNPDGSTQNELCNAAKISSYPTWIFQSGKRVTGEQSFEDLARETSCTLPN